MIIEIFEEMSEIISDWEQVVILKSKEQFECAKLFSHKKNCVVNHTNKELILRMSGLND